MARKKKKKIKQPILENFRQEVEAKNEAELLDKMVKALHPPKKERSEIIGLIKELMDRKKRLFPQVTRMIVDFKVTDLGQDFHIAIASTLGKQA